MAEFAGVGDVAVVVITYQSAAHLRACIESIPAVGEVLVIDNASTDGSAELAESLGARVVRNSQNVGFARAVNLGFGETVAPLVLLLNPDAVLEPTTVEQLIRAVVDDDIAVAAANLIRSDGTPQRSSWPFPSSSSMWKEAFGLHRAGGPSRARHGDETIDSVVGACMLIKRTAFVAVGGFDERFWLYGEETDFCRRCRSIGLGAVVATGAVAHHVGGVSSTALGAVSLLHFLRGGERFVLHHEGRRALVSYRLAVLVGSSLRWPLIRARGAGDARLAIRSTSIRQTASALLRNPLTVPTEPLRIVEPIVVLSLEPWDTVWRRNQFLVRELVTDEQRPTRVLFVEPAIDVLVELRARRGLPRQPSIPVPVAGSPGVYSYRPIKFWPRVLGPWADRSLIRQVTRAAHAAGFESPVAWVNDSVYADLGESSGWPYIYDITDDWTRAKATRRERRRRLKRERQLVSHAAEVVVCSHELKRDRERHRAVHLIPNAVDVAHFRDPQARPLDLPVGPTAVYVGTLHRERIDLPLIATMSAQLPELQIVLVGPSSLDIDETTAIDEMPNVHLLGPRPYQVVPGYLQHADILIVPHVVSAFTESLDPIKLYECLAVGKTTIATPVAGFRDAGPPVTTATSDDFVAAVRGALTTVAEPVVRDVPGWTERATEFRRCLDAARRRSSGA